MLTADELPHVTHTGIPYDDGDYVQALDRAVAVATAKPSAGRIRRGIGTASMVEINGFAPTALHEMFRIHWSGWESSTVRVNEDSSVTVFSGATGIGQGIETSLAQIAVERLGVPLDWIDVQLGDTTVSGYSNIGSQASRALPLAGGALWKAADRLRVRMRDLAAAYLQADPAAVVHDGDKFLAADGASISWQDVAHRGWLGWGHAEGDLIRLEETVDFDPPGITFSYATHCAQVAVDLDTGEVAVEDYWIAHDSGVVVNPLVAEGQIVGGVAIGFGAALHEQSTFDENGPAHRDHLFRLRGPGHRGHARGDHRAPRDAQRFSSRAVPRAR